MSEHFSSSPEHHAPRYEASPERSTHPAEHHETPARHEAQEDLAKIQATIQKEALSSRDQPIEAHAERPGASQLAITKELKIQTYRKTLAQVRKHLSSPAKTFSQFIHQPSVDRVSRWSEKSVARPSGLLGGSLLACLGSGVALYLAKHYGYRYNFLLFAILFIGGFGVGLIVELLTKLVRRP